jgi:hypothetical protein
LIKQVHQFFMKDNVPWVKLVWSLENIFLIQVNLA